MPLTYSQAITQLNQIVGQFNGLTVDQRVALLSNLVASVDASAPQGRTVLLWSGEFRTSAAGRPFSAGDIARLIAQENPQLALVTDTELGKLLSSGEFDNAVLQAVGGNRILADNLLGGANVAGHTPSSYWGQASQRFVGSATGPVATLVGNADQGRIFGAIELSAALNNPNVTHIAGLDAADLRSMNLDDAFRVVTHVSLANGFHISIGYGDLYDGNIPLVDAQGHPLRGPFASVPDQWAIGNKLPGFQAIDTTRGRFADTATEIGARRVRGIIRGTPGLLESLARLRLANKLPLVGVALTAAYAYSGTAGSFSITSPSFSTS